MGHTRVLTRLVLLLSVISHASALPKVFGVGLCKTGTSSLSSALKVLGWKNTLHQDPLFTPFLYPEGRYDISRRYRDPNIQAAVDIPTALYVGELVQAFPDAKFILTVRDETAWLQSFRKHRQSLYYRFAEHLPYRLKVLYTMAFGTIDDSNPDIWLQRYNEHAEYVMAVVPASNLLVLDVTARDAMATLCYFLGLTISKIECQQQFSRSLRESHHILAGRLRDQINVMPLPVSNSRFAYVTQVGSGMDEEALVNNLIEAVNSLRQTQTVHDIVVISSILPNSLRQRIKDGGINNLIESPLYRVHSTHAGSTPYFQKLWIYDLVQYERVIYFDSSIRFMENADSMFEYDSPNTFFSSSTTPLDADLFVATPNRQVLADLVDYAESLLYSFTVKDGFLAFGPITDWRQSTGVAKADWSFDRAYSDQGLLYWYFFCVRQSPAMLVEWSAE